MPPSAVPTRKASPQEINAAQKAAVLQQAVEMTQQIYSQAVPTFGQGTSPAPINVVPRNVGLIKKFIVEVTGNIHNTDTADALTLTDLGMANFFSQISFIDLNNNTRIQTAGWHVYSLYVAKHKRLLGPLSEILDASQTTGGVVAPGMINDNYLCAYAPQSVAKTATLPFRFFLEIPLAYSDEDLRGSVYANVVNATMSLQLVPNTSAIVAPATDSTLAVYKGATGYSSTTSVFSGVTVTVYQVYLDQLPVGQKGVILPMLDLSTVYELKNTTFSAITATQDFPIPFANFRDFLSVFTIFNDNPAADAGRVGGTDINYWALQSANFTNIWKVDPFLAALRSRNIINVDWVNGQYYFPSRKKPISTTQYGNMELILNASSASAGAYCLVAWEDFALVNTLTQAGSLAG
jgi:hypothetical protein